MSFGWVWPHPTDKKNRRLQRNTCFHVRETDNQRHAGSSCSPATMEDNQTESDSTDGWYTRSGLTYSCVDTQTYPPQCPPPPPHRHTIPFTYSLTHRHTHAAVSDDLITQWKGDTALHRCIKIKCQITLSLLRLFDLGLHLLVGPASETANIPHSWWASSGISNSLTKSRE